MPDDQLDGLVEAARAGGSWAFGRLWEILSPVVAGYLRGRGVRDVDDVTSSVFLAAFQGIGSFSGDGAAFRRWLFTIAHHRGVDDIRAAVRQGPQQAYEPEHDPRAAASAESDALAGLSAGAVRDLLAALPDDQRQVILLRVIADLAVEEVAAIMERSPAAVRQLQKRALDRLRRHLADETSEISAAPVTDAASSAMTEPR